ncbi:MAG: hypothetical protein JXD22_12420 [Sedimentisphaerales bacterium]|nr:hypothetical protein [Sedimentisphaerales bacterium]
MYELDEGQQQMVEGRLFTLRILYMGMLGGIITFFLVVLYLRGKNLNSTMAEQEEVLSLASLIFVSAALIITFLVRFNQVRLMALVEEFSQVLQRYFIVSMVGMALCEGASFICLIFLLLGVNQVLMTVLFGLVLIGFLVQFPTRNRMVGALQRAEETRALRQAYRIDD